MASPATGVGEPGGVEDRHRSNRRSVSPIRITSPGASFRAWCDHPDADEVTAELERDGSLTPALAYYRANVPPTSFVDPPPELPPVTVETMGIWSSGDRHLLEQQMLGSADHCASGFRYERVEGAGHWMMLDAPGEVTRLLLDFLGAGGQPS